MAYALINEACEFGRQVAHAPRAAEGFKRISGLRLRLLRYAKADPPLTESRRNGERSAIFRDRFGMPAHSLQQGGTKRTEFSIALR